MKLPVLLSCLVAVLVLAGCNQSASTTTETDADQAPATVDEAMSESSGDVDQDFEVIEAELDKLDVEADFPNLEADDLTVE